jgi:hypothetical protein
VKGGKAEWMREKRENVEEKNSQATQIKHTTNIQIQDFPTAPVGRGLEWPTPRRAGITDQNIQSLCTSASSLLLMMLSQNHLDLLDQALNLFGDGDIAGDADGFALDVWEIVELLHRLKDTVLAFVFAADEDGEGGAREEEARCRVQADASGAAGY